MFLNPFLWLYRLWQPHDDAVGEITSDEETLIHCEQCESLSKAEDSCVLQHPHAAELRCRDCCPYSHGERDT